MEADVSLEAEDVVDADEPEAVDETPEAGEAAWGSGGGVENEGLINHWFSRK